MLLRLKISALPYAAKPHGFTHTSLNPHPRFGLIKKHKGSILGFATMCLCAILLCSTYLCSASNFREEFNAGLFCYNGQNYECAIKHFQKAVEFNPNSVEAYNHMGYAYGEQENYKHAIRCFQKSIELELNNYNAFFNMGLAYQELNAGTLLL
jgi:tetratricopeptide (TPR) repeat protein